MEEKTVQTPNMLTLENRSRLCVTGVSDVDSFNEQSVTAYTDYGQLTIQGSELNIKKLSVETGELMIEGMVSAMIYTQNRPRESLFKRMFR